MARVVIESISKTFQQPKKEPIQALRDINLVVEDQELIVLVGPSGSGKTTLLRLIAGLEEPTQGTVSFNGSVMNLVPPQQRDVAMVFQNYALYPHMTAFENMAFGLKLRKHSKAEIENRVWETAELLGLKPCLDRLPNALSGGERQRVALGRAIVGKPKVLLLDEPLSNLDTSMRAQLRVELARLQARLATTMIYVTHDQVEAMTLGHRIAVLREGTILQVAAPVNVYQWPATLFVAGFIGSPAMNLVRGCLKSEGNAIQFEWNASTGSDGANTLRVPLPERLDKKLSSSVGCPVVLGIRPEHLMINLWPAGESAHGCGKSAELNAVIEVIEARGPETYLHLEMGQHRLTARVDPDFRVHVRQKVVVAFNLEKAHFFDPTTEKALI
ncbi:MAG: ABC transporter ATP-binding protein [Verrucomicrobia bacterium]|nr:ABC transporter ATP-binding protein [Verrucomicrobiota bacterium]